MSKEAQSHELTYDLIKRAVHGDQEAIEAYLRYYDAYINSLVMYDEVGPDSQIHSYIDEDMKITSANEDRGRITEQMEEADMILMARFVFLRLRPELVLPA